MIPCKRTVCAAGKRRTSTPYLAGPANTPVGLHHVLDRGRDAWRIQYSLTGNMVPKNKKKVLLRLMSRNCPTVETPRRPFSFSDPSRKASWTAMCHDPRVQGRCREQARRAGQVRNHCYGPAPRRTPVSTAHAFSFSAPCLSQLLHRAQCCLAFPAHPSFRSPSPIANLLAPWPCQALQTIACSPGEDHHSPCPVVTACFNFL